MAYKLITSYQAYVGASTDAKPTGVEPGAKAWEYDTGAIYITRDGTNWGKTVTVGTDLSHWKIHDGDSYTAYYSVTTANLDAQRSGLYIKTGTIEIHAIAAFSASGAAFASIQEAPTIAAGVGTASNDIFNRKRDSTNASTCLDNANPAVAGKYTTPTEAEIAGDGTWALGTMLRIEPLVTAAPPKVIGGSTRDSQEYILKANTKYVFLLTNYGASVNLHEIYLDWYEKTI